MRVVLLGTSNGCQAGVPDIGFHPVPSFGIHGAALCPKYSLNVMNQRHQKSETKHRWLAQFPPLARITDSPWLEAVNSATEHVIPRGTRLFRDRDIELLNNFVLVLRGSIRVIKVSDHGREILLYRIKAGEVCVFNTISQLLPLPEKLVYGVTGFADAELHIMSIPSELYHRAFKQSDAFREFIMSMIGRRLRELLLLLEQVTFKRLDFRLAHLLLDLAGEKDYLHATHQELALSLGTVREVISRMLAEFEHQGWIELHRAKIRILSPENLRHFKVT